MNLFYICTCFAYREFHSVGNQFSNKFINQTLVFSFLLMYKNNAEHEFSRF